MNLKPYLDSTYLKTAAQAGLDEAANTAVAESFIREAIAQQFKLIMIRPWEVLHARTLITESSSKVLVGTVIDFPEGKNPVSAKIEEATKAIADGADELDFVVNYTAFQSGDVALVKDEVLQGTRLGLENRKAVKWIIEVAALTDRQIVQLSALIKNVVLDHFKEEQYDQVFVKSSTGFYPVADGKPNGATRESIIMMLENAYPLPVKAAGGVRTFEEAVEMVRLGVKRIGTSSAKAIAAGQNATGGY